MAGSLFLDERALILAPESMGTVASKLLSGAGIGWRCTNNVLHLGQWLNEGVGMVIVAEQVLADDEQSALQQFIDQQPVWSDLPVLLLAPMPAPERAPHRERLGNLMLLPYPFEEAQLLMLVAQALRARRRQYLARDQFDQQCQAQRDQLLQRLANEQVQHHTRKMEAIGQLAGGVAHDFNNLLTSIGGSFELIDRRLKQGKTEGIETVLRRGQEAVARAARLTHRLLAFSSRQSLQSQSVDLYTLLQPSWLRQCLNDSIRLQVHLAKGLWPVDADDQQLRDAVQSLLLNACEAMPSGGCLCIEARNLQLDANDFAGGGLASGDYLQLSISDDGQGMPESVQEHAFEPFFSTKPVGQGIGLGLSMVYGFSKQSHGHVTLHSQIGRGTRVELYLPRFIGSSQALGEQVTAWTNSGREVLVVEDDPHVRALLHQALSEDGFLCHTACDAEEALTILRSPQAIALLISDVGLPGTSGRQLAEIARTLRPDLQVLFITGYAEAAMSREGFLGPGMQLMCKPFELSSLRQRVAQMLGER
ncbi:MULTISPECIES: ATP-binding protein [unclassified Pseudomonas]|uniref:ATP-binding protein n=1 Tax=unclassified Pseudomonas TaxID=196821 RepID=UPI0035BF9DA5